MIPNAYDPFWCRLVKQDASFEPKFLGLKLLLLRSKMVLQRDGSEGQVQSLAAELHSFFVKNEKYLTEDIRALFG